MHRKKKYHIGYFMTYHLKIAPFQTLFTTLCTVLDGLMPAYLTVVLAHFVDTATAVFHHTKGWRSVFSPLLLLMLYVLYLNILPSLRDLTKRSCYNRMKIALDEEVCVKRARLKYRYIEDKDTMDMIQRVGEAPAGAFKSGFNMIRDIINIVISSASLLAIVMTKNALCGVAILAVSTPLFILSARVGTKNYSMGKTAKQLDRKNNYITDILTKREYAQERSLFGYAPKLNGNYAKIAEESNKITNKINIRIYANDKRGSLVTLFLLLLLIAFLLPSLRSGTIGLGLFVGLVNGLFSLVQKMSWRLAGAMEQYTSSRAYLEDFTQFMNLEEKAEGTDPKKDCTDFVFHTLEFRNVTFRYPHTTAYVLENCSFTLHGDKSYAFVGKNGAGKSTIVKLLIGMYDDYEGDILLNGRDIRTYHYAQLKSILSVVFQDFVKYAMTVQENITFGNYGTNDENKMRAILEKVGLTSFVASLPDGIDTSLGKIRPGSVDASGGQWQRLAIARLLYSDAPVYILDEPTAALDPVAESAVYRLFSRVNAGHFTIYITHRLGAARMADEILVLDKGAVAECGSHEALMKRSEGIYRNMFESQKSWYTHVHTELAG